MIWRIFLGFLSSVFILFVIFILFFYWFVPSGSVEFILNPELKNNYNFTLYSANTTMQFYENLRYPEKEISYKIDDMCTLQKKDDMIVAFNTIEAQTILDFFPINNNEEIFVTCEDKLKVQERFFIAGEGGPTNITRTNDFNVITHGGILLLKDSKCERPNVAIHELLHALGFDHSPNPNNIMYNISKCNQVIGDDILRTINEIYSVESKADLSFENVSAVLHGKYLDFNVSIRNNGLKVSGETNLIVYADDKIIKEISLNPMEIGSGLTLSLTNVWVPQININKLKFNLSSTFEELNKNNNIIELEIKKSIT